MLEYIFFDERPWKLFITYLDEKGLVVESQHEMQGYMVRIPDDTDDAMMAGIECYYDEMLDMNEALYIAGVDAAEHTHNAGVSVSLSDGRVVQALVDPALLNKVLEVLSMDELGQLVSAITDAVEHPDERSVCRR